LPTIFLKAESVNTKTKAPARDPDAMASIMERTKRKNFCCHLSAKQNASAVSGATQHRNPTQAA
jgi:hypothetical protein